MKASDRLTIPRKDLRRQVFRAGGPGGQHQNKTDSAVRWVHVPSGVAAESRSDRSQHANSDIAYERLCEKLLALVSLKRKGSKPRPDPASFGYWMRSYRLVGKDQQVEDVDLEVTERNPRDVLAGGIDSFINARLARELSERAHWTEA